MEEGVWGEVAIKVSIDRHPAQAGVQADPVLLGSRLRGNDEYGEE